MIRRIPEKIELILAYNNLKPKAPIGEAKVLSIGNNIADFKTMQFEIHQVLFKDGAEVEHPAFDSIKVEQLVLVKDYGYYVIKNIVRTEDTNGIKKVVDCVSIETKLAKKMLVLPHKVIQLKKNDLDKEDGILDIMEAETGWKLKHLDEKAQYDIIGTGKALKYRNIEVSETWWNFLSSTLQQAYDVVVYFDHLNKEVSVFDRLSFGKDTKLILSRKNFLDSINKTFDNTDIITRMFVEGDEGVAINSVNPLGTSYVEDFSFFATEEYMSKELIEALDMYYPLLDSLQEDWYEENEKLLALQREKLTAEESLSQLNEELKAKKALQTEALKDANGNPENDKLKELKSIIDKLEADIEAIKGQIKVYEDAIKTQTDLMAEISTKMSKEEMEIDGVKVFTSDTIEELDSFIMEGSWQNTYYTTNTGLYLGAKEQIKKVCKPSFEMSIGLHQLALDVFQAKTITSDLYDLGDFVLVENEEMSIRKRIKEITNPILVGKGKNYRLLVGEDGALRTKGAIAPANEEMIITDITGKNHLITVGEDGRLISSEIGRKSKNIFKVRDNNNIYKIEITKEGALVLIDDNSSKDKNDFERVRIIGYTYSPESGSTELVLSTAEFSLTQEGKMSSAINSAVNAGKQYHRNKMSLEQARNNANWIEDYYRNALDVAHKNIMAAMGNNDISITENGIIIRDKRNLDDVVMMAVGGIILSKDGLESARTAITADGIVAEELMGQVILGKQVYIADEKGELEIKGNLMTIYDNMKKARVKIGEYTEGVYGIEIRDADTGAVAINSKGMLQRERMTFSDNLDATYPYTFTIPLDAGLSEIRECSLFLEPKKFRAYSRSVAGGGALVGTTEANSDQTSKPSSMTTSKVNINTGSSAGYGYGSYGSGYGSWYSGGRLEATGYEGAHYHLMFAYMGRYIHENGLIMARYQGNPTPGSYNNNMGLIHGEVFGDGRAMHNLYTGAITMTASEEETINDKLNEAFKDVVGIYPYEVYQIENGRTKVADVPEELINEGLRAMFERADKSQQHTHNVDHYHSNYHAHNIDHTHTVSAHSHEVKLDDHEHDMIFGIWQDEETATPTVNIDGRLEGQAWQSIYKNINVKTKLDLKPFLDKVNVLGEDTLVEFRITAKTRARVEGSMIMKCMTKY